MSDRDTVRTLIGGTDSEDHISNSFIDTLLADETVYRTAGICLRALAANRAFLAYRVKTLTYESEDKASAALKAMADDYFSLDEDDAAGGAAEQAVTDANVSTILYNQELRD